MRKDLFVYIATGTSSSARRPQAKKDPGVWGFGGSNLVAALCSEVWQKRKRTSFRDFLKAYLLDMMMMMMMMLMLMMKKWVLH